MWHVTCDMWGGIAGSSLLVAVTGAGADSDEDWLK